MLRFLADENFDNDIIRGLQRHIPELDILRVQDIEMAEADDPQILERAQEEDRIVLTHDVSTIPAHAYARLRTGLSITGVCIVPQLLPIGQAIQDLLLIAQCSTPDDWEQQVKYLPLK